MTTFGVMNHLDIHICQNSEDAVAKGHTYDRAMGFTPAEIEKVVVVREGTNEKRPTVDLVLRDEKGNRFVVMITGRLLKSIPCG